MKNLIKSVLYQTLHDNICIYCMLAALLGPFIIAFINYQSIPDDMTGSMFFAENNSNMQTIFLLIFIIFVTRINGGDFADKTINYEISIGHKKTHIFFSRVIISYLMVALTYVLIFILPVTIISLYKGWGGSLKIYEALYILVLALFPLLRYAGLTLLYVEISKRAVLAGVLSFITFTIAEVSVLALYLIDNTISLDYLFSSLDFMRVLSLNNSMTGFFEGNDILLFLIDMDPLKTALMIGISAALATIYHIVSYIIFKKTDF